jgi:hypothetical protein
LYRRFLEPERMIVFCTGLASQRSDVLGGAHVYPAGRRVNRRDFGPPPIGTCECLGQRRLGESRTPREQSPRSSRRVPGFERDLTAPLTGGHMSTFTPRRTSSEVFRLPEVSRPDFRVETLEGPPQMHFGTAHSQSVGFRPDVRLAECRLLRLAPSPASRRPASPRHICVDCGSLKPVEDEGQRLSPRDAFRQLLREERP